MYTVPLSLKWEPLSAVTLIGRGLNPNLKSHIVSSRDVFIESVASADVYFYLEEIEVGVTMKAILVVDLLKRSLSPVLSVAAAQKKRVTFHSGEGYLVKMTFCVRFLYTKPNKKGLPLVTGCGFAPHLRGISDRGSLLLYGYRLGFMV